MRGPIGPVFLRYAAAVTVTALAVLVRWLLDPYLGVNATFTTLYGAVAFAVWFGGYRPALFVAILGYLACDYLFVEPRGAIGVEVQHFIALALYLCSCSVIVVFGEALRAAHRRAEWHSLEVARSDAGRHRAEEALRRSTEQLRIVTDHMAAPVVRCGRDLTYLWVSKSVAEWIGRPVDEIVGRPIVDILGPEAFEQLRSYFEQVLAGKKVVYEREVNYRGIGRRWVNATYVPTFDKAGVPDGWVSLVLDISERKRLEAELQRRVEQLAEADHRKDEFLATLSHELRNPLAPICNAVELLRTAGDDAAHVKSAQGIIERQVRQLVRLVDDLLDLSRITRGLVQVRNERVELAAVVRNAVEATRPLVDAAGHELTVSLPPGPVWLDADPTRLTQVFANLLSNAAKYTDRSGRISLTVEQTSRDRQGAGVTVSIRDTGIGIAPDQLPRIFDMFSQVAPTLDRSQGGLGIGLTLVRGLVELHGGTIEAHSEGLGRGSEFLVHLPVAGTAGNIDPLTTPPRHHLTVGEPRRILVVDDSPDCADSMAELLRMMGHETETAYDGLEAIRTAGAFRPDAIVMDIGLPKLNGYEAARRIREQPWGREITLIALSGWGQDEDKRRALDAGFDHHETKPVEATTVDELLASTPPKRAVALTS